jgi:phosphate acyltransferase
LNIGEEDSKGNELTREAYNLLSVAHLNFVGNVESMGLSQGAADVAVCDGFVGNVVLKFAESVFEWMAELARKEIAHRPVARMGALLLKPVINTLKEQLSYEQYGGAPLLGIDGTTIICHGRSSSLAISNAIRTASRFVRNNINQEIKKTLDAYQEVTVE